jgi:predicted RNA-binding Zn ribbon-like protein
MAMTKLLERAVDSVRALPPEVQDELARLLLQVAGEEQPVIRLTAEERADLAEADAEISRGEFATDEQMRSILAKRIV